MLRRIALIGGALLCIPFAATAFHPALGQDRADQLLFGADFLMPGQVAPQFELLDSLNLPDEVQARIYRGNASRLLKLA